MAPKAVITGGTRGIGVEVAIELAQRGYAITVVGRDEEHGEQAVRRIGDARFIQADLSVLAEVRALGARLAEEGPLQVLVNNVGGMWSTRWETADGIEASFALNHLSPTVLTEALLDALRTGRPSRVVDVTSSSISVALMSGTPVYQEIEHDEYYGMAASGRAKLAHLAYNQDLAQRLRDSGVSVFAADPGPSATPNAAEMTPQILPPALRPHWEQIRQGVQRPAADGARPVVFAATDPSLSDQTGLVIGDDCTTTNALTTALTPELITAVDALTERVLKRN
ncbi:SDR family NAD(P)-dependent oxidoreductase [Streptomyces mirabilis]|jgi:NAD(P)-dependent dehydrogenase (short-subunit alcohol dehydrogenase family)